MKSSLWRQVKTGTFLLFADLYEGVFRVLVKDVDIRIQDPDVPGGYSFPYGLTADTGTVKVKLNGEERVLNLADLIVFSPSSYDRLLSNWEQLQTLQAEADKQKTVYLALLSELK